MRIFSKIAAVIAAIIFIPAHVALAEQDQEGPSSTVPDITGHWDAMDRSTASYSGAISGTLSPETKVTIEIQQQEGFAFTAQKTWMRASDGPPPSVPDATNQDATHDGIEYTSVATEDMVGVFNGSGDQFYMVEHPDTGMMMGRVLDPNRVEIIYIESGEHGIAMRTVYERRQ